jgi:hypothetical protein
MAKQVSGLVKVGAVDCTVHESVCGQFKVSGYPTILMFPAGTPGKPRRGGAPSGQPYNGERTAAAMAQFAMGFAPNKVRTVDADKARERFATQNAARPRLYLFSEKSTLSNFYRGLASEFDGRVAFALVPKRFSSLAKEWEVTTFPTLVLEAADGARTVYTGKLNKAELTAFLEAAAPAAAAEQESKSKKKPDAAKPSAPPKAESAKKKPEPAPTASAAAPAGKAGEAVQFTSANRDELVASKRPVVVLVGDAASGEASELAARFRTSPVVLAWLPAGAESTKLVQGLGLPAGTTAFVARRGKVGASPADVSASVLTERVIDGTGPALHAIPAAGAAPQRDDL